MSHPYPSLFNNSNSPLKNAYLQSLEPLRARMHLISLSAMPGVNDRIALLAEDCVAQGVGIDEELDKGKGNVDRVMAERVRKGLTEIDAYKLPDVKLTPQSTDPAAFAPFAGDTSTMPELWIQDPAGEGPNFAPGIDATAFAINGTGNPRCNPRQLTEFVSNTPGENGCMVRVDQFGFRLKPGVTAPNERRFKAVMQGQAWWFEAYEKGTE
jgi:hypothetical protein